MKALVTGITGFAGGHLAAHLLAHGDQVLGTSRREGVLAIQPWSLAPPGTLSSSPISAEPLPQIPLVAWNVGQAADDAAFEALARFAPDAIYHLAAESIPHRCGEVAPTPEAWQANVGSVSNVMALAESLPRRPRVLLVSSSQVYAGAVEENVVRGEDHLLEPKNGYGKSKLAAEREARRAAETGLEVVIARAFNHSGPGQWPPLMLPEWCEQLARPGDVLEILSAQSWLDLSDVRDVVRAYRLLMTRGAAGSVYNVGSGVARRTGDLVHELLELAGPRRVVEKSPQGRPGVVADVRRIEQATGWRAEIPLRATLADTLAWWRSNPKPRSHDSAGQSA